MTTRPRRTVFRLALVAPLLVTGSFALTASADTPSAGKTKNAVATAEAATKKASEANGVAFDTEMAAYSDPQYPDTPDGRAAAEADRMAAEADGAAYWAEKAAGDARERACKSGNADDVKAADAAEKASQDAEARADAADAAADKADRKADPFGKQLQKKARDADRAARAASRAARAAICFARRCAQLMDESSEANKKKQQEAIDTIEGLSSSVYHFAFAPRPGAGVARTARGLQRATFDTPQARLTVNLPDRLVAGDTLSGTVVAEPKGQTPDERTRNLALLSTYSIFLATPQGTGSIASAKTTVRVAETPIAFKLVLPSLTILEPTKGRTDTAVSVLGIHLASTSASPPNESFMTTTFVPIGSAIHSPESSDHFEWPTVGQQGRPHSIDGPFDGDFGNTTIKVGGRDVSKLAESPRGLIFESPADIVGVAELAVRERGVEVKAPYRNLVIRLSAPKTALQKGEAVVFTGRTEGLQGITEDVPLELVKSGVVAMEGGDRQTRSIKPSEVQPDGSFTMTRTITGRQAGAFSVTATVMSRERVRVTASGPAVFFTPAEPTVDGDFLRDYRSAPPREQTIVEQTIEYFDDKNKNPSIRFENGEGKFVTWAPCVAPNVVKKVVRRYYVNDDGSRSYSSDAPPEGSQIWMENHPPEPGTKYGEEVYWICAKP